MAWSLASMIASGTKTPAGPPSSTIGWSVLGRVGRNPRPWIRSVDCAGGAANVGMTLVITGPDVSRPCVDAGAATSAAAITNRLAERKRRKSVSCASGAQFTTRTPARLTLSNQRVGLPSPFSVQLNPFCLHQAISDLRRFISDLHQSILDLHWFISGLHRSIPDVHRSVSGLHQSILDVHRSVSGLHQSIPDLCRSVFDSRTSIRALFATPASLFAPPA